MTGGARTFEACIASAIAEPGEIREDILDLRALVGKTVRAVERYQFGWRMRFTDGTAIYVNECQTFDSAGNFVREP